MAEIAISSFLAAMDFIPRGFMNHPTIPGSKIYMYDTPAVDGKRKRMSQGSALNLAKQIQEKQKNAQKD